MAIPNPANMWRVTRSLFRTGWQAQPVLLVSCVMGVLGPLLIILGPGTKSSEEERRNWPTHYRLPPLK